MTVNTIRHLDLTKVEDTCNNILSLEMLEQQVNNFDADQTL
jgi:hypothetical protein